MNESLAVLQVACRRAGRSAEGAQPIRIAENAIWRLRGGVVARVTREVGAQREVEIATWLASNGVDAVRPLHGAPPVVVDDRTVTFWEELPEHDKGDYLNMAVLLRQLHRLPSPDFLSVVDPFASLHRRLSEVRCLDDDARRWLLGYVDELKGAWEELPPGLPHCVIHGDAWSGNCAVSRRDGTAYLLDFDRVAIGPPEWDLTSIAIALTLGGPITRDGYRRFCDLYGYDVMSWQGYLTMRAIRELRMATWSASVADVRPEWLAEVQHRVDCLRGLKGERPWQWRAIL